ncbi:MAG: non-ribosomal peptide synthetase, partial [Psychrosphaera sp.]|nr:non-ribosomal peptide synthetase [Psychrosphaera sp.]
LQTHQNVARLFSATAEHYGFDAKDVWVLCHSIAFDVSVWELWGALTYGAKLIIPSHDCTRDTQQFVELCQQHQVTVLNQTPSAFNAFSQQVLQQSVKLPALRYVVFAGEALQVDALLPWWHRFGDTQPQLINMYGITEITVHATFKRLRLTDIDQWSVGQLLPDQCGYVLNRDLNLLPMGCEGELYIGGAGLAQGYLNQPELTAERFIQNPFSDRQELRSAERLYKTGDLVRCLPDGQLVYVGRADDQVKIRGFRIELGEIEHQLSLCDGVNSTVVLAREDDSSHSKQLVAYLVADDTLDIAQIKGQFQRYLPNYMVPGAFVLLDALPLTTNGKVDKKALPAPDGLLLQGEYVAAETDTEQVLTQIWADLLKLKAADISVTANFFDLGGHSLLSIRLVAQIRQQFGQEVAVRAVFDTPTLRDLALVVAAADNAPILPAITPRQ